MMNNEENLEAIEILLAMHEEDLSDWEVQFFESIANQEWISEKQQEILDRIWDRIIKGMK